VARRFAVDWAEIARTDLDELLDYIEQDEPGCGPRRIGPVGAGREAAGIDARELIVRPWRIIYRVGTGRVLVLAVLDGRRDLEGVLLARLLRRT
jgi:toxin ParE1/3/4